MKKINLFVISFLTLSLGFLAVQCNFDGSETQAGKNRTLAARVAEEKSYSKATLENHFSNNRVVVVLNKDASLNFKTYTREDFSEIAAVQEVTDSTRLTMEVVRQQLEAEKTGN
jgi:hypothetical protein